MPRRMQAPGARRPVVGRPLRTRESYLQRPGDAGAGSRPHARQRIPVVRAGHPRRPGSCQCRRPNCARPARMRSDRRTGGSPSPFRGRGKAMRCRGAPPPAPIAQLSLTLRARGCTAADARRDPARTPPPPRQCAVPAQAGGASASALRRGAQRRYAGRRQGDGKFLPSLRRLALDCVRNVLHKNAAGQVFVLREVDPEPDAILLARGRPGDTAVPSASGSYRSRGPPMLISASEAGSDGCPGPGRPSGSMYHGDG